MRFALCFVALASVASSQLIDLDAIALDFDPPELVKAPINVESDIPAVSTPDAITPLNSPSEKRDLVDKRDGDCSPYQAGSGPVPTPDTPDAFLSDPDFATMASNAPTPDGYALVFHNLSASLQASNYMGLYTLTSYDTLTCASKCDQANCSAFNVYFERDPTLNAGAPNCPDPPSTNNYKCTLWGAPVSTDEATNTGQYQSSFHVVIAGSNAYNKKSPPSPVNCYSGPQELGGAINAPPSTGSYMGYQYFPFSQSQGYNPQTCVDACDAQTAYDSQHPAADGSFMSCVFFNSYVLSKNSIPQGLYCSMYNETWDPSYGTNYGQYRGSDRYTVSESYSYSKTCNNPDPKLVSSISSSSAMSSVSSPSPVSSPSSSNSVPSFSSTITVPSASPPTSSTALASATSGCNTNAPIIQNGGFESGTLSPWSSSAPPGGVSGATSSIVRAPSPLGGGGTFSFYALFLRTPANPNPATVYLSQQLANTCAGVNYTVSADYDFVDGGCSISPTGVIVQTGAGWNRMQTNFTAVGGGDDFVSFSMTCSGTGQRILLDSVNVTRTGTV